MPKPKIPTTKIVDLEAGTLKDAVSGAKTGKLYHIPLASIAVHPDFNARVRDTENYAASVEEKVASYQGRAAAGKEPFIADRVLTGFVGKDGDKDVIYVIDGHRRYEGAIAYNEHPDTADDAEIETLPFVLKPAGTSMSELNMMLIQSNSGDPLTPYEQGVVVVRELDSEDGMSKDEIAAELGVTRRYVDDLELLARAKATVRNHVVKGEVSATLAIQELRRDPDEAAERLSAAVAKAKDSGKKKATKKDVGPKLKKHSIEVSLAEGDTMGAVLKAVATQVREVVKHNAKDADADPDALLVDGRMTITVEVPEEKKEPAAPKKPAAKKAPAKKKAAAKKAPAKKKAAAKKAPAKKKASKADEETAAEIAKEADKQAAAEADDEVAKVPPKVDSDPDVPDDEDALSGL